MAVIAVVTTSQSPHDQAAYHPEDKRIRAGRNVSEHCANACAECSPLQRKGMRRAKGV